MARLKHRLAATRRELFDWRIPGATPPTVPFPERPTLDPDKEPVTPGWRFVSIGFEGDRVDVGGLNPWKVEWRSLHERICVAHPSYPAERHDMYVYEVQDHPSVRFAAGEFSNGVWGFFVPQPNG